MLLPHATDGAKLATQATCSWSNRRRLHRPRRRVDRLTFDINTAHSPGDRTSRSSHCFPSHAPLQSVRLEDCVETVDRNRVYGLSSIDHVSDAGQV